MGATAGSAVSAHSSGVSVPLPAPTFGMMSDGVDALSKPVLEAVVDKVLGTLVP